MGIPGRRRLGSELLFQAETEKTFVFLFGLSVPLFLLVFWSQ